MKTLLPFFMLAACLSYARAFLIVSNDGIAKDFAVIKSASRDGLVVRETASGRDIPIPWHRLDLDACKKAHPWLAAVQAKALVGETVPLDLGLGRSPDDLADWRTKRKIIRGGGAKNFSSLALTAHIHRDVKKPRLAIIWVGDKNPLASRGDAADFARRANATLVLAAFTGNYVNSALGSGEAIISALPELLAEKSASADPKRVNVPPAIFILGEGEGATFAWSFLCEFNKPVIGAVCLNGVQEPRPNATSFATPLLLLETARKHHGLEVVGENLDQPFDLWRHYSTEGCRWSYANPVNHPDPLSFAISFAQGVVAASPYQQVLDGLEDWENNELKNRIPMPTRTVKDFKETAFLLGTLGARQLFPVPERKGDARHDLIWLPSTEFARTVARFPSD